MRSMSTGAILAMLRGSVWTCGLPPGWISPSARSITFGISSLATYCDASKYPGVPSWILLFPLCVSRSGIHPISSSEPEHTSRSAERIRAMRLGRASTRCGSCSAVVAEYTDTLSPPSSCASALHSGSQANTLSAAAAGSAASAEPSATTNLGIAFMFVTSEFVGAVGAQTHDVLEEYLIVGHVAARFVARDLQADPAELARAPVDHHGVARRVVRGEDREIGRVERSRKTGGARVQPVISIADPPHRDELINALEIPARLHRCEPARLPRGTGGEIAILLAPEVLALQLEVGVGRVVVRRPLQDSVQHPKTALARETVGCPGRILEGTVLGRSAQIRDPGLPRGAHSHVSADVREQGARTHAVLVASARRTRGKVATTAGLDAYVEIQIGRSHPFELDAVFVQLVAEEHLVRERRVGEVPGVRVNLVLVTDAGEETPRLDREPV